MTAFAFDVAMAALGVNGPEDVPVWDTVEWRRHEENVRRLRGRIFKATTDGDWPKVRNLQKLMLRSWSNTLTSVRQVAQRNAGRKTAGIDGAGRVDQPGTDGPGGADPSHGSVLRAARGQAGVYSAPCGASSYPLLSREELGGRFLGLPAYPMPKG